MKERTSVIIFAFAFLMISGGSLFAGTFSDGWIEPGKSLDFKIEPYREIRDIEVVWTDAGGDAVGQLELDGRKIGFQEIGSGEAVKAVFPVHGMFCSDSDIDGSLTIVDDIAKVESISINYNGEKTSPDTKYSHYFNRWFEPGQSARFYLQHNKKVRTVSVRWTDEGEGSYGSVYINYRLVGSRSVPDSEYGMTDYFYPFNMETDYMASGRIDIRSARAKIFNVYVTYDYSYNP